MFIIVGKIPPPLGGVSIYCKRKLESQRLGGGRVKFLDIRKAKTLCLLIFYLLSSKASKESLSIELNTSNKLVFLFFLCLGLAKYTVFFDHNSTRRIKQKSFNMFLFKCFIRRSAGVYLVNAELKNFYIKHQIYFEDKTFIKSPFLAPTKKEISIAQETVPDHLKCLLEGDAKNIVLASAHWPKNTAAEPDLYGVLDTLKIYKKILGNHKELKFVLLIGRLDGTSFSNEILKFANELMTENSNFYFGHGGIEQAAFLKNLLLLIRLTKTDGDSLSVREALMAGANVIASDVCPRPEGVNTVPLGDISYIENQINTFLLEFKIK